MPALKIPHKAQPIVAPFVESRVPGPEEFVVLSEPLLNATLKLAGLLKDCKSKWALSGNAGELVSGVSVPVDHLSLLTTAEGCEEISNRLAKNAVQIPRITERQLDREANVDLEPYPVQIKSYEARFQIEGQRLHVYGGLRIRIGEWEWGDLRVRGVPTPGHSDDMVAFLVGDVVFTGDTLFKDAVGGGDLEQVRSSVMDVFMSLPDETRVLPGHTDESTIGRERTENPFVRVWSGAEPEGSERVRVAGREATLIVWSPDYDGKGKAWVRYADGSDAIVGGSRVERT